MSVLANHSFAKMNGIGNEIVVVDLRDSKSAVTAEEARAVASPAGVPYDQLMVLQPPRLQGTEAFIRIYNNDGSEAGACGNGMRCVLGTRCAFCGHRPGQAAGDWWDGEYLNEPYPHVPLGFGRADPRRGDDVCRGHPGPNAHARGLSNRQPGGAGPRAFCDP